MVFEKGRLERGKMATRMMPLSWNTQLARQLVDDMADRLISSYPREQKALEEAVRAGNINKVQECEKKIAQLLDKDVADSLNLNETSMYIQNQVLKEIVAVTKKLDSIKTKAVLKPVKPEIEAILANGNSLKGGSKALFNRAGAMVTSQSLQTVSMKDQTDALRGIFTPMVLDGRAQRKLTHIIIKFGKKVEKLTQDIDYAVQSKKDVSGYIKELAAELKDFNKYMNDEFKALVNLRLNSMIALLTIRRYSVLALQGLRKLLAAGFPEATEKSLEENYKQIFAKLTNLQERLMWDEQYESEKMVADTFAYVARLLEEVERTVDIQKAA